MILLIDNYDSFSYNLYQLVGNIRPDIQVVRNDEVTVEEILERNPQLIILSPGPGRPEQAGICIETVKRLGGKIPIFGVCLGHQAICRAYGGAITYAKKLMHGKTSQILTDPASLLFRGLGPELTVGRYHQVSTDEVYGDLPLDRPDLFFTEETPIHTSSPYSASKASADLLVLAYHRTFGLPVTISRCSNNYGPYHFPEKLIPLMIANCLNDKPLPVYGKGENVRDWLYVEDHCKAIDLIIRKGRVGEVYNIGGHNEMKNIDIVKLICKALDKPESLITYVTDRKGHDMRYAIDPTKIHNELGWLPETKFADGIQKTIQWYLDNRSWWEEIISGEYQNYYEKMYANR